ncbi:hypothetical protein MBLNU459_g3384t1 [Dothideomycetes sp. NU459]
MHLQLLAAAVPLISLATAYTPASTYGTDKLALQGVANLAKYESTNPSASGCTIGKAYVRKEWSSLNTTEKKAYISAVKCLMSKPSISGSIAPGAKSRYDDFVATHINQTLTIHGTGNFLSWHRYFTYTYETALRNECGYKGYQPYLNWGKYALDLQGAPVFDGSDTSMSGNGAYKAHSVGAYIPSEAYPFIVLPPGNGSGCVTSGPFMNMSVNLGPLSPIYSDIPTNPQADGLGYNPRCLRRDINNYVGQSALTDGNSTDLINLYKDVGSFQSVMQGDFAGGLIGVHTAGHYATGGDPGGDIFASPGDPYFFLHHAQIDRTWWIWQNQDLKNRQNAIAGTITLNNNPASRNTTLSDVIELGVNAPGIAISTAMSTTAGPFCYIYV